MASQAARSLSEINNKVVVKEFTSTSNTTPDAAKQLQRKKAKCIALPPLVCAQDYATAAATRLPVPVLDFFRGGAMAETTLRENTEAMNRWYILPRMLRDVSRRDLSTTVLGQKISLPVGLAPIGLQRMAHPHGECATARAAGAMGTAFTLSTAATSSIEEVAAAAPDTVRFFQLFLYKDRKLTEQLVRRAECAGYSAIALTVDANWLGIRRADVRNRFSMPSHLKLANFESTGDKATLVGTSQSKSSISEYVKKHFDTSLTWDAVKWLVNLTHLPVVAKGVLHPDDALKALQAGAAAVWVSNHGARQVDGAPPMMEALPHVVAAVGGRCPVFVDGGFRQGTDVFKALALGADMVFVGRPVVWGLTCAGEQGVKDVLTIIRDELDNVMANTGCRTLKDITRNMVIRKEAYSKL